MQISRGLYFTTYSGAEYYYDDHSGLCFPCTKEFKQKLQSLTRAAKLPERVEAEGWGQFIRMRSQFQGALLREKGGNDLTPVAADARVLASQICTKGFQHLLLVVTESCNLRCRYCIFSDEYPFVCPTTGSTMSHDTAIAATRYYLEQVARIRRKNPNHPVVITFYGGEPLLNYPVIEAVIAYVRSQGIRNVTFSISTNGLLLNDKIVDYFVENEVSIAVSLDGPQSEHDRNRVRENGKGSFAQVLSRLERLWSRYPDYPYLVFLVTYDFGTNLEEVRRFFASDLRFRKSLMMFSQVSSSFTDYYLRFSKEQSRKFWQTIQKMKQELLEPGKVYGHCDPVLDFFFGMPLYLCTNRRVFGPTGREGIPTTETCLPGEKLCVLPSGKIQVCEKTPGLDIGTVEKGLDFDLIKKLIDDYNRSITSHCSNCQATRFCGSCYATFWSGESFRFPNEGFCKGRMESAKNTLMDVWSILEKNPEYFSHRKDINPQTFQRMGVLTM